MNSTDAHEAAVNDSGCARTEVSMYTKLQRNVLLQTERFSPNLSVS